MASAQQPYAVVLTCADSRVAPEIVFTAGLGDLFVIRVAGNIVSSDFLGVLGSIEYGIADLNIPLVVVLGHESCGAVTAAVDYFKKGEKPPGAISAITDAIQPAVGSVAGDSDDLLNRAITANVEKQVANLLGSTAIVAPAVEAGQTRVMGGVYELKTGHVRFLE